MIPSPSWSPRCLEKTGAPDKPARLSDWYSTERKYRAVLRKYADDHAGDFLSSAADTTLAPGCARQRTVGLSHHCGSDDSVRHTMAGFAAQAGPS